VRIMPSAISEIPGDLVSLVHDFLKTSGFNKAAKALKKEYDGELEEAEGQSLLDMFKASANVEQSSDSSKKKRKASKVEKEEPDEVDDEKPSKKSKSTKKEAKQTSDNEEDAQEVDEEPVKKKDKKKKQTVEDRDEDDKGEEVDAKNSTPSSKQKKGGATTPFKRIKEEDVSYMKVKGGKSEVERLRDNTFESKGGDVFGAKASEILVSVRGKDFRHEKNKKKKGTYRGGPIDMNSNSIKFEESEDE